MFNDLYHTMSWSLLWKLGLNLPSRVLRRIQIFCHFCLEKYMKMISWSFHQIGYDSLDWKQQWLLLWHSRLRSIVKQKFIPTNLAIFGFTFCARTEVIFILPYTNWRFKRFYRSIYHCLSWKIIWILWISTPKKKGNWTSLK